MPCEQNLAINPYPQPDEWILSAPSRPFLRNMVVILPYTPWSWKRLVFQFSYQQLACILLLFEACRILPFIILDHRSKIRQSAHILQLLIVSFVQLNAYWHGVKMLDSRTQVIITTILSRKLELLLRVIVISFNYKCIRLWYRVNPTKGRGLHETKTLIYSGPIFCHSCSEL